jgi:DNA-binding Lrp family transcriptional regulator
MKAFILLTIKPNCEEDVHEKLEDLSEVIRAHTVFGPWDLIAEVDTDSIQLLNDFAVEKLRKINNITSSSTLIVAK